jgi:hypothetical protein
LITAGGRRPIEIGASSRDIRLKSDVTVPGDGKVQVGPKPGQAALADMVTGRLARQ